MTACHKILASVKNENASNFQFFKGMMDRIQVPAATLSRATSMPSLSEPSQDDGEDREGDPRSLASSQADSGLI